MVRVFAKSLLAALVSRMPVGARRAVLDRCVARDDAYHLFQTVGRRYGIRDIRVAGDYGLIEGSIDDEAVLATYARAKRWAESSNIVFERYFAHRQGGTYIDIGANIGLTTIPVARNPRVDCKAFEPEPTNFGYLRSNVERNCRHGNVETFNLALFDAKATLRFELCQSNRGDHRVRLDGSDGKFGEGGRTEITVPADRLDDVLDVAALARPIAAKIDTQGAESQVFSGGRTLLGAAELVVFEFWPYGLARLNGNVGFLTDFLERNFVDAAILAGDRSEPPLWQPVSVAAGRIKQQVARGPSSPYVDYEVLARK